MDFGRLIYLHGLKPRNWSFGNECVKQLKADDLDGYISFLTYCPGYTLLMKAHNEDMLNVFCFGGAAKHVWVLLYVMSTKRTKHGLQFLDSSEQIVIQGTSS